MTQGQDIRCVTVLENLIIDGTFQRYILRVWYGTSCYDAWAERIRVVWFRSSESFYITKIRIEHTKSLGK